MQQPSATNMNNAQYDLISVLYHSLEEAQTCATYVQDAQKEGDQELAQFFHQVYQDDLMRCDRARQLLASRMMKTGTVQSGAAQYSSEQQQPNQANTPPRS